jgi:hypothetical protein
LNSVVERSDCIAFIKMCRLSVCERRLLIVDDERVFLCARRYFLSIYMKVSIPLLSIRIFIFPSLIDSQWVRNLYLYLFIRTDRIFPPNNKDTQKYFFAFFWNCLVYL